jgi:hypothetical protein
LQAVKCQVQLQHAYTRLAKDEELPFLSVLFHQDSDLGILKAAGLRDAVDLVVRG